MIDLLKQFVALDIPVLLATIAAIFAVIVGLSLRSRKALSVATRTMNAKTQFS